MLCLKLLKIEPLNIKGVSMRQNLLIEQRIETLLNRWERTPYISSQCVEGRGVDCVHFIACIYDTLLGTKHHLKKLPQDTSFHNKPLAEAGLKTFLKLYPSKKVVGDIVQPGDTIICGPVGKNGGPGHGMIVGTTCLWHVDTKCVCRAGLGVMQQGAYAFKQIRRLKDRKALLKGNI